MRWISVAFGGIIPWHVAPPEERNRHRDPQGAVRNSLPKPDGNFGKNDPELMLYMAVVAEMPLTGSALRKYMRGQSFPPPEVMVHLANFFGLSDYRHVLPPLKKQK